MRPNSIEPKRRISYLHFFVSSTENRISFDWSNTRISPDWLANLTGQWGRTLQLLLITHSSWLLRGTAWRGISQKLDLRISRVISIVFKRGFTLIFGWASNPQNAKSIPFIFSFSLSNLQISNLLNILNTTIHGKVAVQSRPRIAESAMCRGAHTHTHESHTR